MTMKWDRIMITGTIGLWLALIGAYVIDPGHFTLRMVLMAVALTCGVFFMVAAWPQIDPIYRRWMRQCLGIKDAAP
jgi:hypothetical protein